MGKVCLQTFTDNDFDCELKITEYKSGELCVTAVIADTDTNKLQGMVPGDFYAELSIDLNITLGLKEYNLFPFKDNGPNVGLFNKCIEAGLIEQSGHDEEQTHSTIPLTRLIVPSPTMIR